MRYGIALALLTSIVVMGCQQPPAKGPEPAPAPAAQPRPLESFTPTPPPPTSTKTTDSTLSGFGNAPKTGSSASGDMAGPTKLVPGGKTYTIQKGDTLFSIAKQTMGDPKKWVDIKAANPGLDEKHLPVGKVINIPEK